MNATLSYQPYRLPAGLLAVAVHCAFFALLYFGFTWQSQPAMTMSVELWQSLPEVEILTADVPEVAAVVPPAPQVKQVQPPQQEKSVKPDIALPDKKDKRKAETKPVVTKAEKKQIEARAAQQRLAEQRQAEAEQLELIAAEQAAQQAAQAARERAEQAARDKAAQDAAIDAMVNEFTAKITSKIRRNVVMPPDVRDDARAEFRVTLLPGGTVLSAELKKSSGNAAYDNAVERGILKSQPLPLPPDATMFNRFRVLQLRFKPVD